MNQATRRRMLRDMGVDTWLVRVEPDAVAAPAPDRGAANPLSAARAALAQSDRRPAAVNAAGATPASVGADEGVAAGARTAATRSARQAAAPGSANTPTPEAAARDHMAVLSLALPGVVLLCAGSASRRDLRLAMDVVAAVACDWTARPESRRFDWPPPGSVAPDAGGDASRRALRAFVEKDLQDHRVRLLVCTADVAAWLAAPEDGVRLVQIPPLAELGSDPDAKRHLWTQISATRG
ncbi:MAG: hypothetical protein R3E86_06920 [Pseudomonadales bacterium]